MLWNSRQDSRPNFIWRSNELLRAEWIFLSESGRTAAAARRLEEVGQSQLAVRILKDAILSSFEIDGEVLDPQKLEASIRGKIGLAIAQNSERSAEAAAAALAAAVLREEDAPIDEKAILGWRDRFAGVLFPDAADMGGNWNEAERHEMRAFFHWYDAVSAHRESPLVCAGLAHLWFESMHLFGEATGVVGRMLTERLLKLCAPSRNLLPVSVVFRKYRHEYHRALDEACRDRDAGRWLPWFAAAVVEAARISRARLEFNIEWHELVAGLENRLSARQRQLLRRLLKIGGEQRNRWGLSALEYAASEGIPPREAQRELSVLVEWNAVVRIKKGGEYRYRLNLTLPEVPRVFPEDIT